ncbi:Methyltransferase type 12 [Isosphaera pallida ATCC 43644]|uniref:Methyltransferase type 12 n=1 Tax=Isosphaera pallida (strain ATCC 43644 / DSM 9630 / IS1B) TaxID=575540 RepID=E8QZD1_ISOPI|nr:class I SAM-dependent methyltransferase [Isosphaera pallida]ADV64260.1 Methyltransferase type 12 [Isosphaera pallida ATCC 43644]
MIETWSVNDPEHTMSDELLAPLRDRVRGHFWWRARSETVRRILELRQVPRDAAILDVGCGWGTTLEALERDGRRVVGMDVSRKSLEALERENPQRRLIEADLTQPWPKHHERFQVLLCLDVIEHLDDDRAAVSRLAELVEPGGLVVVSVPALPELFSEYDEIQGHRRRYRPESLTAAFEGSGLILERVAWWGEAIHALVKLQRAGKPHARTDGLPFHERYARYLKQPPWPIPPMLGALLRREIPRVLAGRTRIGTSLFALARKP